MNGKHTANGNGIRGTLKALQWSSGAPSRSDYELYLVEQGVLKDSERLSDRNDLSEAVYRDWERRSQIACVFARRIATQPRKFNVDMEGDLRWACRTLRR